MHNLLTDLPRDLTAEQFDTLLQTGALRLERIVSMGHASPPGFWYDQPQHEWVLLLQGEATLRFEDRMESMKAGDSLLIPAQVKHRVESTSPNEPTIWLALHYAADPQSREPNGS